MGARFLFMVSMPLCLHPGYDDANAQSAPGAARRSAGIFPDNVVLFFHHQVW
jgi:hypothetical protein